MNCKPIRHNDQMQCHCGLAWDIGEEQPECRSRRKGDRREDTPIVECEACGEFCICKENK